MLARIRKAQEKESGFTLIELLVVMIIIGILAAIAIPTFLNQKRKARQTSAKSDATNISKELAAALVDGNIKNTAPTAYAAAYAPTVTLSWDYVSGAPSETADVKVSNGNLVKVSGAVTTAAGGDVYCVTVKTTDGDEWSTGNNVLQKGAACP